MVSTSELLLDEGSVVVSTFELLEEPPDPEPPLPLPLPEELPPDDPLPELELLEEDESLLEESSTVVSTFEESSEESSSDWES